MLRVLEPSFFLEKDTLNLAAEELGRELTVNEKKVLAQMSPEELKQASEEQGVKLV